MKKYCLLFLVNFIMFAPMSFANVQNSIALRQVQAKYDTSWLIGKWYPTHYFVDTGDGNEEKFDFDECTKKSSIEFLEKGKFISIYATGADCSSFLEPVKGKFSINESNNEFNLTYGTRTTTSYKYQKVDDNTLVLIEYRDKNNDGKEDKILNYYQRK
ncbi:lipocalin-like domain-containing protein [Empedobacter sedimenti]|uniref:lipocalin family protein n=1 Tax=Empedobacter sedimenti TaxID=3042610 RepID=UPI0024A65F95|nr:lipocalin family protein [Empedobacter sedimenti]